jgi:hypothetical protein
MEYSDEFINSVTQLGALAYSLSKIINILDIKDVEQFTADFDNPQSVIGKAYQIGIDRGDFAIDKKLYQLSGEGDLDAIKMFTARRESRIRAEREDKDKREIMKDSKQ